MKSVEFSWQPFDSMRATSLRCIDMATVLRPMSAGELLDRTFFLYRKNFVLFAGIVAIPYLATFGLAMGQLAIAGPRVGVSAARGVAGVVTALISAIVYLLALAASQAATVVAVSHVHLDRPASIASSYGAVKSHVFKYMLIMLGLWIAIGIGFVLLIVPGIMLALMWALVIPVAVLENKGLSDSAARSKELTKGNRGRIFAIYFLFVVLYYIITVVLQLPAFAILGISKPATPTAIPVSFLVTSQALAYISQCLVGPLLTIALALVYYDERVRKEAFDLQVLMANLDGASDAASATSA
jgi:Membrane domain of glycerophosphoryl diester phosphodiesterase